MKSTSMAVAWLLSIPCALTLGASPSMAQTTPEDDRRDAAAEELPELSDLTEEEAAILADALERIQMLRQRGKSRQKTTVDDAGQEQLEVELSELDASAARHAAAEATESLEAAVEQHAEQLAEAVEEWAEKFGAEAEDWAETFAEDMEAWAEDYSEDWEQWAETHGEKWERWADEFAGKWEKWSEQFEDAQLSKQDMSDVVRENLEMIQQMPLSELYGQLSKSSEKFQDLPWDRLHEIEEIVQQSVRHSLESVEQMGEESANTAEQQERIRLLQKSLKQLNDGLSAKRAELEAAAANMMGELDEADVEQAQARAKEAQQRLAEVYEVAKAQQAKAAQVLDTLRSKANEESARKLYEKALKRDRQRAAAQQRDHALKLRKEVAERVAIDHHEQELNSMRAEIDALRAEIEALRAKQRDDRPANSTPQDE